MQAQRQRFGHRTDSVTARAISFLAACAAAHILPDTIMRQMDFLAACAAAHSKSELRRDAFLLFNKRSSQLAKARCRVAAAEAALMATMPPRRSAAA